MSTVEYKCKDDPEADGRVPQKGDRRYTLKFPLENGDELQVHMGNEGMEIFRTFLGNEVIVALIERIARLEAEKQEADIRMAAMQRGPEFYAYTPGAISDERLEGMIDETRWWKVPGDEVYEVVRELRDARRKLAEKQERQGG